MGFTSTRILLFQSINSVIALIGEACCVLWVDQTGRRKPLIIGNIMSGLSFVVGSILMARWPGSVNKWVGSLSVFTKLNLVWLEIVTLYVHCLPQIRPLFLNQCYSVLALPPGTLCERPRPRSWAWIANLRQIFISKHRSTSHRKLISRLTNRDNLSPGN